MVGYLSGSDKEPYEGEFHLSEEVYTAMVDRAAERPKTEVGGMLFGDFEKEDGEVVDVRVERVVNVPDDQGVHQATYFSINNNFMHEVVDDYIPPYTYLGNWHSHLGYGGPSSGDHEQVTKFFCQNPDRDYLIAIIQDRSGGIRDPEYDTYIELYERKNERSTDYQILNVSDIETIDHPPERTVDEKENTAGDNLLDRIENDLSTLDIEETLSSDLLDLATEITTHVDQVDEHGVGTVYQNLGDNPETILLVPVEFSVASQNEESESRIEQTMDEVTDTLSLSPSYSGDSTNPSGPISAFLSTSIPSTYPDGKIYVDIKSRDQTVQATVLEKSSAELRASPREFCNQIQTMLESDADEFFAQSVGQLFATRGGGE